LPIVFQVVTGLSNAGIFIASVLWQVKPRSDGADHQKPAAKNLGVGLLVTALAHLHVRNFAQELTMMTLFSTTDQDWAQLFKRGGMIA
jgi:hypothetical protein